MKNFFKYLTPGEEERKWGLFLNSAGRMRVNPSEPYPDIKHPTGYYFKWDSGRELQEYQINYITRGEGIFELEKGKYRVSAGNILYLEPNNWHRYRPISTKGWTENYIGFSGSLANRFMLALSNGRKRPIIRCGLDDDIMGIFNELFNLVLNEKPGFQMMASGLLVQLIGKILSLEKGKSFTGKSIERKIEQARFLIQQNIENRIDLQALAGEYNLGYSYFRRMFREYTGVSPSQYHLQLRLIKAKEMLLTSDQEIKEIAYHLGFETVQYFNRVYKAKMGVTPGSVRKANR